MMKTLFLQAPSFDGFDGGAGARYQARREIQSFWYPTWLAQPAALVEGARRRKRSLGIEMRPGMHLRFARSDAIEAGAHHGFACRAAISNGRDNLGCR